MESKKGAFIVLGLLLVLAVVLLIVCAKRGGAGGSNVDDTIEAWKKGLLSSFAKSQQLAATDLDPNPFNAKGEATLSGSAPLICKVPKSDRTVRRATLELAGPGHVEVHLVAPRDEEKNSKKLDCKKKLDRSTSTGAAEKEAKITVAFFKPGGSFTVTSSGGPTAVVKLRWTFE